jgi:WD40 repeat protein
VGAADLCSWPESLADGGGRRVRALAGPVQAIAVDRSGYTMATSGLDGRVKIWDIRTFKEVHSYLTLRCDSANPALGSAWKHLLHAMATVC